ncbi:hypothetical protein [Cryobacterium sp. PAMC25264]|uniref:hypothetical protein n=1 Tax=Cryobacterium sp. PAMC25264 TaxID=2861288 RepID=UPI001C634DE0|nr:hypothetical protein [Cryobacterium sp. PAMC25264]QYF72745.1 hypothetical protein KY500_13200 [Cryobacterium sp. PAMC25264]
MAEARNDGDPYEQARHDAAFLQAVTRAHRGHWDVLDALWWGVHPDEPTPDGTPSPTERLRDLQRRVFAADGDAAGDRGVADALHALETEITAERAAIAAAVAAARSGRRVPAVGTSVAAGRQVGSSAESAGAELSGDDGAFGDVPDSEPFGTEAFGTEPAGTEPFGTEAADTAVGTASVSMADASTEQGAPSRAMPRHRVLLGVALAGAVVLGAVVGSQVDDLAPWGAAPQAGSDAATATPAPTLEVPVLAAQVFARDQAPRDVPLVPMPAAFDPASFRYLGSAGWTDADGNGLTDSPYYAARGSANMICLVAVPEGSGYLSTCSLESDFPSAGLRLSWESTDMLQGASAGTTPMVLDITVAWQRDSTIETSGSGRVVAP